MKTFLKVIASLVTLLAGCILQAADTRPTSIVLAVQTVETEDPSGYAVWLSRVNDLVKAKYGVGDFTHAYVSQADGVSTGTVHTIQMADSFASLNKMLTGLEKDPDIQELRAHFQAIRKLGARLLCKSVRLDGGYPGELVLVTLAQVNDETAYLKALDGLKSIFDTHSFEDARINVYRVMAGRSSYSHLIAVCSPNAERHAALLDFMSSDPSAAEWLASTAKFRTVVGNGSSKELTAK